MGSATFQGHQGGAFGGTTAAGNSTTSVRGGDFHPWTKGHNSKSYIRSNRKKESNSKLVCPIGGGQLFHSPYRGTARIKVVGHKWHGPQVALPDGMFLPPATARLRLCIGDQLWLVHLLLLVLLLSVVWRRLLLLHDTEVRELEMACRLWEQLTHKSVCNK